MPIALASADIDAIYRQFVLPKNCPKYLRRYRRLPLSLLRRRLTGRLGRFNEANAWIWLDKDFARVPALLEFRRFARKHRLMPRNALMLNAAGDPELEFIRCERITHYQYPRDEVDLHTLDLPEKNFDFFMANQTLEHVYDPAVSMRNVYRHLVSGGILYLNVPCISIPHDTPFHHYTGFTPVGLGCVVRQAGFEILDIGFWGNTEYHDLLFRTGGWPDCRQLKSYVSEFNRPVISWVFARKPIAHDGPGSSGR